jgi:hypothetical protein
MPSRILRWKSMVSKHIICAVSLKFVMRLWMPLKAPDLYFL